MQYGKRASTGRWAFAGPVIHDLERYAQEAGAACEQFAVGNHYHARRQAPPRKPNTQVWPDACGFAGRYRDEGSVEWRVLNVECVGRRIGDAADNLTLAT